MLCAVKHLSDVSDKVLHLLAGLLPRRGQGFAIGDIPVPLAVLTAAAMIPTPPAPPDAPVDDTTDRPAKKKSPKKSEPLRRGTLMVFPGPVQADRAAADASVLLPNHKILLLSPADDEAALLTGERIGQVRDILSASEEPHLILTSVHALLQPVPDPKALRAASCELTINEDIAFDGLIETCASLGYERVGLVTEPMTFAVRGGILDIWPAGAAQPVRAEFFGDTVDGLRLFDPVNQCSVAKPTSVMIPPCPSAKLKTVTLFKLLGSCPVLVCDWPETESTLAQLRMVTTAKPNIEWFDAQLAAMKCQICRAGDPLYGTLPSVALVAHPIIGVRDAAGETGTHNPEFYATVRSRLLSELDTKARDRKSTVVLCADSPAARTLLRHALPPDSPVTVTTDPLSEGFELANLKLTVVAQSDIYPTQRTWSAPSRLRKAVAGQRLEYAFDVEPGELVVHLEHGIGRFLGLAEIEMDGRRTEVFTLEYADGAKLHVPTTHAHLLSRYIGPDKRKVRLHSLDGTRWNKDRLAAQQGIEDLAAGLLETQARRRVMPGFAFKLDDPWLAEFEALFPWQETPDQARVIEEIRKDMGAPVAMDRLLCGDAGYGKTEVAMRAAFIAVTNHKQVAVLAPTTVLAEQHYATFCDRMAQFPIRIEVLSRFRSKGQRAKTRLAAAEGQVDIMIGTHALLTENVPFHDLGLLIIDEEQRFGVAHKEQLKRLRAVVDVLTMSATPIPRTLYLSLTGARDLSLLQTPPQNRMPVETVIRPDTDEVLSEAIRRELARGGQIFYLYNRVKTIGRVYERLRRIVPEAKILVGHGQMNAAELAETMRTFERGEADILLCTTIIESGIDIPRANTILIDRADRFGLAELYQLRGRVGRSAVRGFAYLLLAPEIPIDRDARRRLQALKRHSGLGAGYNIALRDLEIRGSGNLLGAAQSGHIAAIGFGLYCQLLRRTVARMKGDPIPNLVDVEITFDFLDASPGAMGNNAASLPYGYIDDEAQRMNIYRRIAEAIDNDELNALRDELADRYGPLPNAAQRAFRLASLRMLASEKRLAKIETRHGIFTCYAKLNHAPVRGLSNIPLPDMPPDETLNWIETLVRRLP